MIGRLIERLFVQVQADLSQLSGQLNQGVAQTQAATAKMAQSWSSVNTQVQALQVQLQKGIITQSQYLSQMNRLASSATTLAGSYRQAQQQVFGFATAARQAAAAMPALVNPAPVHRFTRSLGQSRMQMMNLGYQLNDIGMTLSTGVNPMTVLIQQGSQIMQIYAGQGGVRAALGDIGNILGGLGKRLWPLAILAGGFGILQREINKTSSVTVSFGDTVAAVFQVLGRYIYPFIEGPLNDLMSGFSAVIDFIAEWFPKVMNGVIAAGIAMVKIIGATWDLLPWLWDDAWTAIKNTAIDAFEAIANFVTQDLVNNILKGVNRIIQAFSFAYEGVKIIWSKLPDILKDAIGGAVNWVVEGAEKMVNVAIEGINKLIAGMQSLMDFVGADKALELFGFSGTLKPLDSADLSAWRMQTGTAINDTAGELGALAGRVFNQNMMGNMASIDPLDLSGQKGASHNAFSELGRRIGKIVGQAFQGTDYMGKFFEDVKAQAIVNAEKRVAAGLGGIGSAAGRAAEEVKSLMDQLQEKMVTAADNLAGIFGNAFSTLAEEGKVTLGSLFDEVKKYAVDATSRLIKEQLSLVFQQMLKGSLGTLGGNFFSWLFAGNSTSPKTPGRARGGVEMPWRNFIAGEEGAELISQDGPSGARRVMTAGRTAAILAGSAGGAQAMVNTRVVVNNYSGAPVDTQTTTGVSGEQLIEIAVGKVIERVDRGAIDKTMRSRYNIGKTTTRR